MKRVRVTAMLQTKIERVQAKRKKKGGAEGMFARMFGNRSPYSLSSLPPDLSLPLSLSMRSSSFPPLSLMSLIFSLLPSSSSPPPVCPRILWLISRQGPVRHVRFFHHGKTAHPPPLFPFLPSPPLLPIPRTSSSLVSAHLVPGAQSAHRAAVHVDGALSLEEKLELILVPSHSVRE